MSERDCRFQLVKQKISSYTAQYSILRIEQRTLHFTSLADLFNQTPSQLLWEASSHMQQLKREGCPYTYPPLSVARYSFIQLSELKRCGVKTLAQGLTQHRIRIQVLFKSRVQSCLPQYNAVCFLLLSRESGRGGLSVLLHSPHQLQHLRLYGLPATVCGGCAGQHDRQSAAEGQGDVWGQQGVSL